MKKIFFSLLVVLSTISCIQAQKTSFDKEALDNVMYATDKTDITFEKILNKYKGKIVVIDVWASWCSDCIKGLPKVKSCPLPLQMPHIKVHGMGVAPDLKDDPNACTVQTLEP